MTVLLDRLEKARNAHGKPIANTQMFRKAIDAVSCPSDDPRSRKLEDCTLRLVFEIADIIEEWVKPPHLRIIRSSAKASYALDTKGRITLHQASLLDLGQVRYALSLIKHSVDTETRLIAYDLVETRYRLKELGIHDHYKEAYGIGA